MTYYSNNNDDLSTSEILHSDIPPDARAVNESSEKNYEDTAKEPKKGKSTGNASASKPYRSTRRLLIGFLAELAAAALILWAALSFVICVRIHYGNNMFPAVRDGDLVVTLRPQRPFLNAVVLYEQDGATRLGRVVGMNGHVIDISEDGALRVNGVPPAEEVFYPTKPAENTELTYPYTVGEGQVFLLNDYRTDTNDSRTFGAVDLKDVKGPLLLSMRRRGF